MVGCPKCSCFGEFPEDCLESLWFQRRCQPQLLDRGRRFPAMVAWDGISNAVPAKVGKKYTVPVGQT